MKFSKIIAALLVSVSLSANAYPNLPNPVKPNGTVVSRDPSQYFLYDSHQNLIGTESNNGVDSYFMINTNGAMTTPAGGISAIPYFDGVGLTTDSVPADLGYNPSTNTFYTTNGSFSGPLSSLQLTSTIVTGTAPLVVASTTNVANLNASSLNGATFSNPGAIGGGTAAAANFTTVGATGQITSTLITGTAPFVVSSTTAVANLSIGGNAATATSATTATNLSGGSVAATTVSSSGLLSVNGGIATSLTSEVVAATYSVGATDYYIPVNYAGTVTLTLPTAASPNVGRHLLVRTYQAQTVVSATSNVTINGAGAGTAILAATAGKWAELISDGTNWEVVSNN